MATIALYYLPLFYFGVFVLALILAIHADLWRCGIILTLIYLIAWIPEIWLNAPVHMVVNLALFGLITLTYTNALGWRLSVLTCLMMLTNGYFTLTEQPEFYRHSVINLLFLAQCIFTIRFSYNSHNSRKRGSASAKGMFQAKVSKPMG